MRLAGLFALYWIVAALTRAILHYQGFGADPLALLSDALWAALLALLTARLATPLAASILLLWTLVHAGDFLFLGSMGSTFDYRDLHYLFDRAFLQATLGAYWPLTLLLVIAGTTIPSLVLWRLMLGTAPPAPRSIPTLAALGATLALYYLTAQPEWRNSGLVPLHLEAVALDLFTQDEPLTSARAGNMPAQDIGRQTGRYGASRNVLLVVMEGLTGAYLPQVAEINSEQPPVSLRETGRWAQQGWLAPDFITHARQTSRGMYAMLCGDYPKLRGGNPKPMELLDSPATAQQCLPHQLARRGYQTAYFQAANLRFMSKDRVMPFIGFQTVQGREAFPDMGDPVATSSDWGPTDRAFFRQALPKLEALAASDQPWFSTLLTVGTHYPYSVTASAIEQHGSARLAAVAAADQALGELLQALSDSNILDNTLVIVTSDEAHGVDDHWLGQNWGMLMALAPDLQPTVVPGVHATIDTANSILDYLGFYPHSHTLQGRSLFRQYDATRDLLFSSMTLKMLDADGLIHSCTRRARASRNNLARECTTVNSASGRLFDRDYRPTEGDFLEEYRSLWEQYRRSEFRFRDQKPWQELSVPGSRELMAGEWQSYGAQHSLEAPADSLLTLELDLSYVADPASKLEVALRVTEVAVATGLIPNLALPPLQGGDQLRARYTVALPQGAGIRLQLYARVDGGGGELRLRQLRAALQPAEGGREYAPQVYLESPRQELANIRFSLVADAPGVNSLTPILDRPTGSGLNIASGAPEAAAPSWSGTGTRCFERAFQPNEERAIRAYLVYYNRPADPAGLAYWAAALAEDEAANGTIIRAFGTSDEFEKRFGNLDTESLVTNLYRQMFNRDPDPDDLDYYARKIKAGRLSREGLGLTMASGVMGEDRQVFDNRLQVSRLYTATAETIENPEVAAALLTDLLQRVTADPTSITAACSRIGQLFQETGG